MNIITQRDPGYVTITVPCYKNDVMHVYSKRKDIYLRRPNGDCRLGSYRDKDERKQVMSDLITAIAKWSDDFQMPPDSRRRSRDYEKSLGID